ncbi:MAG: tetratricopeptide repeat protein, partial [Proteobacteria bacterium]|nr:tetratricopeptide repeat protein [Pseudomonadota bacterium]
MLIFASSSSQKVMQCLESFRRNVGPLAEFQAIVAEDPEPDYMSEVFEYGIEKFFLPENWIDEVQEICEFVRSKIDDQDSIEAKTIRLTLNIANGDQSQITKSQEALGTADKYDYIAAYAKGNALQAVGKFNEAVEAFRGSQNLNKMFRQASVSLGESLLIVGKADEAIEILERLEKQNARNIQRKAQLASAYMEKGERAKAEAILREG